MRSNLVRQWFLPVAAILATGAAAPAAAQLVQIRSVPVAVADQHAVQPTARAGMGSLSIAMEDRLLDPFRNPALGGRMTGSRLFGAPSYYSVAEDNGNGKTLPVGGLFSGERWFGTALLALQEVRPAPSWGGGCCIAVADVTPNWLTVAPQQAEAQTNLYGSATLGRRLADGRTSVGLGATYARLDAVGGMELLYVPSLLVRQDGDALDLRLGLTRELAGDRRIEAMILRNRAELTSDLRFAQYTWVEPWMPVFSWLDLNRTDHTETWGAQVGFTAPMPEEGWRAGVRATMNHVRHDPSAPGSASLLSYGRGESWAYSFGLGAAREEGPVTFGIEASYEPIWSTTDGIAPEVFSVGFGPYPVLLEEARVVSNRFRFNNGQLALGAGYEMQRLGFQLGTQLRSIRYTVEQRDVVGSGVRERSQSWMEWKPTWGVSALFPEIEVRYDGSYMTGAGRPFVGYGPGEVAGFGHAILVAPSGPLQLHEARVLSHRVSVAVPIGRARDR